MIAVEAAAEGKKLYRWVDDKGEVYYSDRVPPRHSKHERTELNNRGLTVKVYEAAKTREQFNKEQQLEKLRAEQRRLIAEQRDSDRALLRTFRNVEEMELALKGQLSTVDVLVKIEQANIHRSEVKLKRQLATAAGIERNGKVVPHKNVKKINGLRNQIRTHQNNIVKHLEQKKTLKEKFSRDISRFVALKSGSRELNVGLSPEKYSDNDKDDTVIISLFPCSSRAMCDRAWSLAKSYVQSYATRPLEVESKVLMITKPPRGDNDIGIAVSRIRRENNNALLFLDVSCKDSSLGRELCGSLQTRSILAGFAPFLRVGLAGIP